MLFTLLFISSGCSCLQERVPRESVVQSRFSCLATEKVAVYITPKRLLAIFFLRSLYVPLRPRLLPSQLAPHPTPPPHPTTATLCDYTLSFSFEALISQSGLATVALPASTTSATAKWLHACVICKFYFDCTCALSFQVPLLAPWCV